MAPPVSRVRIGESGRGINFSARTNVAIAAIQSRFMTPPTNKSPINTQQHPKQKTPCSSPIRNAPGIPVRQCSDRNSAGDRQWLKQARLTGVIYTPAATRRPDPIQGLVVTIIGDNNAA